MNFFRFLHVKFRRKALLVLLLYIMGFGYMYSHFLSYLATEEHDFDTVRVLKMKNARLSQNLQENLYNDIEGQNFNQQKSDEKLIIDINGPLTKKEDNRKNQAVANRDRETVGKSSVKHNNITPVVKTESGNIKKPLNIRRHSLLVENFNRKKSNFDNIKKPQDVKKIQEIKKIEQPLRKSFVKSFAYPLEIDFKKLLQDIESEKAVNGTQPINPHPFNFLYTPSHSCRYKPNTTSPRAVIIVKSKAENLERRNVIRQTWAQHTPNGVLIAFLLGLPRNGNLEVRKESLKHGDIIQEDFIDDYRNNTIKMIMGFKWATLFCQRSEYLFFVDDDYFVNVPNLLKYLSLINDGEKDKLFSGTLLPRSVPYRSKGSKWYISWEEYPFDRWPPYLAGGAYFVSLPLARKFYLSFPYVKPMHIDDVYLGIVAKKLGIRPMSCPKIAYTKKQPHALQSVIASHGYAKREEVERAMAQLSKEFNKLSPVGHKYTNSAFG